jgi:hypothetical protein
MNKLAILCVGPILAAALLTVSRADTPAPSGAPETPKLTPALDKKNLTFATDIKPIFDRSCVRCHAAGKAKANLVLDSLTGVLKGGEEGKVIRPGDSASSRLVMNISGTGRAKLMPPPRNKANIPPLTKDQIALIRAWIDQGAK